MKAPQYLGGRCYLGVCSPHTPVTISRVKIALLRNPSVRRLTDHGTHLKVHTTKALPSIRGFRTILTKDHTTDWDSFYWEPAMVIARHVVKRRHPTSDALGVIVHYLALLLGVPEAEFCDLTAARRRWLNATLSDEEAHGWELTALRKAQLLGDC